MNDDMTFRVTSPEVPEIDPRVREAFDEVNGEEPACGPDTQLDDQAWCERHGTQAIIATGSYTGYAGTTCYWVEMSCGCTDNDESNELGAAR